MIGTMTKSAMAAKSANSSMFTIRSPLTVQVPNPTVAAALASSLGRH
jgi:hypothetical protein